MRVRLIRLANNFYKDEQQEQREEETGSRDGKLGEYCCLGYFDALDVQLVEEGEGWGAGIRKKVNWMTVDGLDGSCSKKNIICVTNEDEKDEAFWAYAKEMPCLFVSLIRIRRGKESEEEVNRSIAKINGEGKCGLAYYTYDHSDMVIVNAGKKYSDGLRVILSLYKKISVFKMYSVFAVKEEELENCSVIQDEIVNCRLSATVKDIGKAKAYQSILDSFLRKGTEPVPEEFRIVPFHTLGNEDILIEIRHVPIRKLLRCYKMGSLLTHTNDDYKAAFFNIESQIFVALVEAA